MQQPLNATYEEGNPYGEATTRHGALCQQVEWGEECLSETLAQHRSECALYGDSWPGAMTQIDECRKALREAKAALAAYEEEAAYECRMAQD